jgi:hypothetical protein
MGLCAVRFAYSGILLDHQNYAFRLIVINFGKSHILTALERVAAGVVEVF